MLNSKDNITIYHVLKEMCVRFKLSYTDFNVKYILMSREGKYGYPTIKEPEYEITYCSATVLLIKEPELEYWIKSNYMCIVNTMLPSIIYRSKFKHIKHTCKLKKINNV